MNQITKKEYKIYPVLPIRDIVVFPKMVAPLFVGRARSIKAIEQLTNNTLEILLLTQKDSLTPEPTVADFYDVGVLAKIMQTLRLPDGTIKVLVEATARVKVVKLIESDGYFQGVGERIADVEKDKKNDINTKALMKSVISQFQEYAKYNLRLNHEIFNILDEVKDPGHLADIIASNLNVVVAKKQELLEIVDVKSRLKKLLFEIEYEISLLKTEQKIREDVKKQMEKTQKEYFLNEQLKAIHKELGDVKDGGKSEIEVLEEKIEEKLKDYKEAYEKAKSDLRKLKLSNSMSAEATIIRNYLDYLLALPWGKCNVLKHDIKEASKVLNRDHYGLEEVKERVLDLLAVQKRTDSRGPIICFVGPPGVGKTSLAKSIAEATGREFVKISLGGVRDEAEIRGHRKTYLGAMPGKILYSLKKAGCSNPLFLLDEIDKLGTDWRGDPAAALLEVLDPEQNKAFADHYLEVEYDLSKAMFITTANSTTMHRALLDRMELIRLPGYTEDEKVNIAQSHILKRVMNEHKLSAKEFSIDKDVLLQIIRHYTKEAGIRGLEREIAKLARKAVRTIEQGDEKTVKITKSNLNKYLGVSKFSYNDSAKEDLVGSTTGLAYTEVGGDLLSIEAVVLPGDGKIKATGKLGDVMQESAGAAYSYFKANSAAYGIDQELFSKKDIHVHVPEGATPKDGPSAGIAIFTSIVSAVTGIPVRSTVAMTGEITLRGTALPIGGLKEKLLAAARGGIKTVLIPQENEKDLEEIPKNILKNLKIITIKTANDAIKIALVGGAALLSTKAMPVENIKNNRFPDQNIANPIIIDVKAI